MRKVRPSACGSLDREAAGRKREEIGRERFGFSKREVDLPVFLAPRRLGAVGDRLPAGRHLQPQRPARLQVGLIENRERQVSARRHEQRVEELRVAIERLVAGDEVDEDFVTAFQQGLRWQDDVIGNDRVRNRLGRGPDAAHAFRRREVERERPPGILQRERDRDASGNGCAGFGGDREMQVVAQVADTPRALFGEGQWDSRSRRRIGALTRLHSEGRKRGGRGRRDHRQQAEATDHGRIISGDLFRRSFAAAAS